MCYRPIGLKEHQLGHRFCLVRIVSTRGRPLSAFGTYPHCPSIVILVIGSSGCTPSRDNVQLGNSAWPTSVVFPFCIALCGAAAAASKPKNCQEVWSLAVLLLLCCSCLSAPGTRSRSCCDLGEPLVGRVAIRPLCALRTPPAAASLCSASLQPQKQRGRGHLSPTSTRSPSSWQASCGVCGHSAAECALAPSTGCLSLLCLAADSEAEGGRPPFAYLNARSLTGVAWRGDEGSYLEVHARYLSVVCPSYQPICHHLLACPNFLRTWCGGSVSSLPPQCASLSASVAVSSLGSCTWPRTWA